MLHVWVVASPVQQQPQVSLLVMRRPPGSTLYPYAPLFRLHVWLVDFRVHQQPQMSIHA